MFISSNDIATIMSQELTVRLSQWISANTPVRHQNELGYENAIRFDIDEAIEFCKIKMQQDNTKKEFFPHLVKLKNCQVRGMFQNARSA
ncbi:MAG: hypothetical protein WBF77_00675 [Sulfurimonadaceae bacterium]